MTNRKTILFIGEAASLAHVVRPLVLAGSLNSDNYAVHFACDARYANLVQNIPHITFWPVSGIPGRKFTRAADRGGYVLSEREMDACLGEEFELYARIQPDFIISDLRLTTTISAEAVGISYASISNAHWSPYRNLGFNPVPELGKRKGVDRLTGKWLPGRKKSITASINQFGTRYGLPPLKGYLELAVRGDYTLYPEPPGFIPMLPLPDTHFFLGPVLWEPKVPKPAWWEKWDPSLPVIYLTLGSTGLVRRLPEIARQLAELPVTVVATTAGRVKTRDLPTNVLAADYLPGLELCRLASVVVCNGGSATAYQALSQGVPVIGLWNNIDQYLTMKIIEQKGSGCCLHAQDIDINVLREHVQTVITDTNYKSSAEEISGLFAAYPSITRFQDFLHDAFTKPA